MDWSELNELSFLDRLDLLREILVRRMRQAPDIEKAQVIAAIEDLIVRFSAITVLANAA